jgi:dihydropteroate synthase
VVEQLARVLPVIEELVLAFDEDIILSIDARDPAVAERALAAGATMINDISGGASAEMLALAASHRVPIVLMHMQGSPQTMQIEPRYADVVAEISEFLGTRAEQALDAGIPATRIVVDPGIGFGKTKRHNLEILRRLRDFVDIGYPVMLGTSRKRFMGAICRETVFDQLVGATSATTVIGVQAGVKIFRVHDVRENRQAMEVALAIKEGVTFNHHDPP